MMNDVGCESHYRGLQSRGIALSTVKMKRAFLGVIVLMCISAAVYPVLFRIDFVRLMTVHKAGYGRHGRIRNLTISTDEQGVGNIATDLNVTEKKPGYSTDVLPTDIRHAMENRYVFPVVHLGGGPNFQYRQLKIAIQFAVHSKRTIVLPEFKHHRTEYHIGRVSFDETFNASVFRDFMPAVSMREFREKCGPNVRGVWMFFNPARSSSLMTPRIYRQHANWLRDHAGILIPDVNSVHMPHSVANSWRGIKNTEDQPCVVMLSPIAFEQARLPHMDRVSRGIDSHLVRASFVRTCVEEVLPKLCDGKPILSFHWRNKTGERCRTGNLRGSDDPRCSGLLTFQSKILKSLASHISAMMKEESIGCVFVASAPAEPRENIMKQFYTQGISDILTIDDVFDVHNPDIDSFITDDYFISLTEQEICARSKIFVGVGVSNWSTFIFSERRAFNEGRNYDVISDFPDILDFAESYV